MIGNKTKITLAIGIATALAAGAAVSSATAATNTGSDQAMYHFDGNTGDFVKPGTVVPWTYPSIAGPTSDPANIETTYFIGSADAVDVRGFISPVGQERTPSKWSAHAPGGFVPGTKTVLQPNIAPTSMTEGAPAAVKAAGGEYSIGFAFTKNNGLSIADAGVVYQRITVTPGTGAYTFVNSEVITAGPITPTPGTTGEIGLSATTMAAADGTLSLVVPANASATIGNPTLVNNQSTSTGSLGEITVKDSRVISHKGWTLTSTVADFVAGTSTIPAKQLTVTPKVVGTPITGVTAAAAGAASTTATPFAEAGTGTEVGDTVLNADLKFVAPAAAAAGTYTSKMTLTLTSK
jgi:hypothetical protein